MKLLPKGLAKKIPGIKTTDNKDPSEILVPVKFFNPNGIGTWYVTEANALLIGKKKEYRQVPLKTVLNTFTDTSIVEDVIFFGFVVLFEEELGYFSLNELQSVKTPLGLSIERDLHWNSLTTLKEVIDGLKR